MLRVANLGYPLPLRTAPFQLRERKPISFNQEEVNVIGKQLAENLRHRALEEFAEQEGQIVSRIVLNKTKDRMCIDFEVNKFMAPRRVKETAKKDFVVEERGLHCEDRPEEGILVNFDTGEVQEVPTVQVERQVVSIQGTPFRIKLCKPRTQDDDATSNTARQEERHSGSNLRRRHNHYEPEQGGSTQAIVMGSSTIPGSGIRGELGQTNEGTTAGNGIPGDQLQHGNDDNDDPKSKSEISGKWQGESRRRVSGPNASCKR